MPRTPKRPKAAHSKMSAEKEPKALLRRPGVADGKALILSFSFVDRAYEGTWGWPRGSEDPTTAAALLDLLCDLSKSTWDELRGHTTGGRTGHRKHHPQDVRGLCQEAQRRLAEMQLDQIFGDEIFRFRHGNTGRLWGFVQGSVFHIVWWDPDHMVYPTEAG